MITVVDRLLLSLAKRVLVIADFFGISLRLLTAAIVFGFFLTPTMSNVTVPSIVIECIIGLISSVLNLTWLYKMITEISEANGVVPGYTFLASRVERVSIYVIVAAVLIVFNSPSAPRLISIAIRVICNVGFVLYLLTAYVQRPKSRHKLKGWVRLGVKKFCKMLTPKHIPVPMPQPT